MKNTLKKRIFLSFIANLIVCISLAHNRTPTDSLPLDDDIRYGVLPNGLTYYIKPIDHPGAGLNLRLVVKAGINQEADGELEFAHITEHLGFIAGKNISRKETSHLFDEAGVSMAQLNGFTAGNYTDYFVQVSDKNNKGASLALDFFKDIIWNLELNEKNIWLERLTVFDETGGGNFNQSIHSDFLEKQITGWGAKAPEDFEEHIKTFRYNKLIDFYKKWYRSDLMAIVIVGNIDNIEELEKELKEKFTKERKAGNLPNPTVNQLNYLNKAPQFYKKELLGNNDHLIYKPIHLSLYFRLGPNKNRQSKQGLKNQLIRSLLIELVNKKYSQVLREYNTFTSIRTKFLNPPTALKLEIIGSDGFKKDYINTAFQTLKKIKKYGFTIDEFNSGKAEYLNSIRQTDTLSLFYWKNQIIQHFVEGEALPANKEQLQENILHNLSQEEFHNEIKQYIKEEPEDISMVAYKDNRELNNPEKKIRTWIKEVIRLPVEPSVPSTRNLVLMDDSLTTALKKTPVKALETEISGGKSYLLENGLRIILKSSKKNTSGKGKDKSRLLFNGFSKQGIDCFPKEDYYSALNATEILRNSGVGKFNKFELEQIIDRQGLKGFVSPYIESDAAGIKANIALKDLETAFQLVYLYFTSPNFNTTAFDDWTTQQKIYIAYKDYPTENFETKIREVLPDDDFIPKGQKFIEGLEQIDLEKVKEVYQYLFSMPGNFTFLFSGHFIEEKVLKLCQKYLGNLPLRPTNLYCANEMKDSVKLPIESKTFYTEAPLNRNKVKVLYLYKLSKPIIDWKEEIKLDLLQDIMSELFMRRLRFESDTGGTYAVISGLNIVNSYNYVEIPITFSTNAKDAKRLIKGVQSCVEDLKSSPVEKSIFEKLINSKLNTKISNGNTLAKMLKYSKDNFRWWDNDERKAFINSLSAQDIQMTAKKYLSNKPVVFKMLPKVKLEE
ncbi:insulinase family protein [Zunongwangia sp. SCSIO 43204]|uniref:M16 family metallopeptidase n=1 Tax=Zunongwangia sp. SCSIO 43204 TaxID=2779359 RepID=UPI001CAA0700|nr:insulinase family protein [Zunongwangia sp. SCSIO 43204]UAB85084.1 insulinase family protein [Zunongwangia sp. SCSIO 43204]